MRRGKPLPSLTSAGPSADRALAASHGQGLATALQYVKGVGPARGKLLGKMEVVTVEDALFHLPTRHEDRSRLVPLRSITPGEGRTCAGTIRGVSPAPPGRPRVPLSVLLGDGTGYLTALWFNQAYLERVFKRGQRLIVHGKVVRRDGGPLEIRVADYEIVDEGPDETIHTGRLVPVYRLTRGLTQRPMRSLMKRLVDAYADLAPEPLPEALRSRRGFLPASQALKMGHFPESASELDAARRRLVFEDCFLLQLGLAIRRQREGRRRGLSMNPAGALWSGLTASLPFSLTAAQERVWSEIRGDMAAPHPMNRL